MASGLSGIPALQSRDTAGYFPTLELWICSRLI